MYAEPFLIKNVFDDATLLMVYPFSFDMICAADDPVSIDICLFPMTTKNVFVFVPMACKIYSEDVKFVSENLNAARACISNEILGIKSDLLSVYLMNLVLYKEMSEEERIGSPITEMLLKTSILLEKVCQMEKRARKVSESRDTVEVEVEANVEEEKRRVISEEMKRNKFVKKRKHEDRNPKLKYRNKARKLAEKAEVRHDGNIDVKKNGGSKLK